MLFSLSVGVSGSSVPPTPDRLAVARLGNVDPTGGVLGRRAGAVAAHGDAE